MKTNENQWKSMKINENRRKSMRLVRSAGAGSDRERPEGGVHVMGRRPADHPRGTQTPPDPRGTTQIASTSLQSSPVWDWKKTTPFIMVFAY